jgi:hypothetical protein
MRNPIVPDCVTDDGYASILEGSPEFLFDSQQSFSSISAEIKQVVSTQKNEQSGFNLLSYKVVCMA